MATFNVPYVTTNSSSWGPPSESNVDDNNNAAAAAGAPVSRFAQLPYAPFGRSDRLGRCADFTTQSFARTGDATAGYFRGRTTRNDANKNLEFQYKVDSEEAKEFQLVDSSNVRAAGGQGNNTTKRFVPQARKRAQNAARLRQLNARRESNNQNSGVGRYNQPQRTRAGGRGGFGGRGGRGGGGRGRGRGQWRDRIDRQASVSVRPDWRRVEDIDLGKLSKGTSPLSALVDNSSPKAVEDLLFAGFLDQYNDQYDKVSTRTPAPLKRVETKEFYPVTTTDDPVIEKLAIEGKGTVFATDAILAHLMTCPRSIYPWDIGKCNYLCRLCIVLLLCVMRFVHCYQHHIDIAMHATSFICIYVMINMDNNTHHINHTLISFFPQWYKNYPPVHSSSTREIHPNSTTSPYTKHPTLHPHPWAVGTVKKTKSTLPNVSVSRPQ